MAASLMVKLETRLQRYTNDFRCPSCGLVFEVSRSISQAGKETNCPVDGAVAERIYTPL